MSKALDSFLFPKSTITGNIPLNSSINFTGSIFMPTIYLKTVLISLLLVATLLPPLLSQDIIKPQGELKQVTSHDLYPRTGEGRVFNEFWTYHIFLEDDLQVYLTFTRANFGRFRSAVSGIRLSVINFEGNYYQLAREYPIERFKFEPENNFRFQLHPEREIWFEGELPYEQRIRVLTSKDGIEYDLDLTIGNITQGVMWGDGIFEFKNEEIGIIMHIPYADIEGTIRLNDKVKEVRGTVYMDQTYQTTITPRILSSGYRYIRHTPDNWEIGYFLVPEIEREVSELIGYGLTTTNGKLKLLKPEKLLIGGMSDFLQKSNVPEYLVVKYYPERSVRINREQDLERISFLEEVGRLTRRIAKSYLQGEIVEFRGTASIENSPGYFNYFITE
jgi:hypothetical protein